MIMAKKRIIKQVETPVIEEKREALLCENKAEPVLLLNKAIVVKAHDGLIEGQMINSTAPIVKMMVERGMWRYATTEDK